MMDYEQIYWRQSMTNQPNVEKSLDEIFAFGYDDPTFIHDTHVLIGAGRVKKAKQELEALIASEKLVLLDTLSRDVNALQTYLLHFDSKDKLVERDDVHKVIQRTVATLTQEKNK